MASSSKNTSESERQADIARARKAGYDVSTWDAPAASQNISVVINYSKPEIFSDHADRDGYVQLTRSAGRVYLTVDGRDVGSMSAEEFTAAAAKLSPPAPATETATDLPFTAGSYAANPAEPDAKRV